MSSSPSKLPTWHEGEKYIQEKVGVAERMAAVGQKVVRDYMPDQHRSFYAQLPFIVLGSVDGGDDAWATLLAGKPGFLSSPTSTILDIKAQLDPSDPAGAGMQDGNSIGLLGIEMHTRRRNRMNGIVTNAPGGFRVDVDQSFGNCPRYIQLRDFEFARAPDEPFTGAVEHLPELDSSARAMIEATDAFFVASYADRGSRRQVDVSHRGGKTGFVRVAEDGTLTIPEFNGNFFFATLGNLLLNKKAGLVFVDYRSGDLLQMTGDAEVIMDSPEIAAFQGAERLWTFRARRIVRRRGALALRWTFREDGWSPSSLMTGDWAEAAARTQATALKTRWRPFRVARIVEESASIRSFHLQPADGVGLLPHEAGQHLPIRLTIPGSNKAVIRNYTLSVAPSDGVYRISVKRDGLVSRHLHDNLRVGDVIEARAPAGAFTIDTWQTRPAVLVAGGIGITPLLAMLRHVVYEGLRRQRFRPVVLFYAARSKLDRPFERELAELVNAAQGAVSVIRVLSDATGAEQGIEYEVTGRIDIALITRFLQFNDDDFYLCGPPRFTQALYDGLRSHGIADNRIHAETFGPSSLQRTADLGTTTFELRPPATTSVPVAFVDSLKEARWTPGSGTLLELAEARGLQPEFDCRSGTCGTCATKLLKGAITYMQEPTAKVAHDEVLICCAVPAEPELNEDGGVHLAL